MYPFIFFFISYEITKLCLDRLIMAHLNSPEISKTKSEEFSEFILPGFKIIRGRKVKVFRYFDWLYLVSFEGVTTFILQIVCVVVAVMVFLKTPDCPGKCLTVDF